MGEETTLSDDYFLTHSFEPGSNVSDENKFIYLYKYILKIHTGTGQRVDPRAQPGGQHPGERSKQEIRNAGGEHGHCRRRLAH